MPHNNTRHKSPVALLLIDVINHFEFPDGDALLKNALPMAARLAKLKERCRKSGIPPFMSMTILGSGVRMPKRWSRTALTVTVQGGPSWSAYDRETKTISC
jgi:nicotinamidase-related amidase